MKSFDTAIEFILPHETEFARGHYGDYDYAITENVPGDSGGLTKFGIDQSSHPSIDIASLDKDAAVEIYHEEWNSHNLDALPDKIAIAAFDVWVNGGPVNQWIQHAYNVAHPQDALEEDGILGPYTLAALSTCDQDEVVRIFCSLREDRFKRLAQNPSRMKFLKGWLQRSTDLRALLTAYDPSSPDTSP